MFTFRLELTDGTPADPVTVTVSTPTWRPGDRVFISPKVRYRVVSVRGDVLIVEPDHPPAT